MEQTRFANGMDMVELGQRIRQARQKQQLSLVELAEKTGVSRSMISAVERGSKVPSVVVLDNIADGLQTTLAQLIYATERAAPDVLRAEQQMLLLETAGRKRRLLLPQSAGSDVKIERVVLQPNGLAGAFAPLPPQTTVCIAIERGSLQLTLDGVYQELYAGDSITFGGDCVHTFANVEATDCIYYWVQWQQQ